MKNNVKIIFHIDLNAFYASCAIIKEPYLKDKVFVVGGGVLRTGIITTASYPARKYGIKSAMSITDAMRLYPKLLVVPTDFSLYQKYSKLFFNFLKQYSNLILAGSIDEAYMDMTALSQTRHPLDIAKEMQNRLEKEIGLPSSIGIAPTLFLAKMASDMKKPMGITVLRKKDIVDTLFPCPVKDIHGIGKKTYPRLEALGILTIGDFTKEKNKDAILTIMSEQNYHGVLDHLLGASSDIVDPKKNSIPQSVSQETTLNYAVDHHQTLLDHLKELLKEAYRKLIDEALVTKTVGIKLRDQSFQTITRAQSLIEPTDDYDLIEEHIETLFETHYHGEPLRLVGVSLSQIMLKKDLKVDVNLFNYHEFTKREEKIYQVMKDINQKYPKGVKKGTQ